jgi:hypothetical protein
MSGVPSRLDPADLRFVGAAYCFTGGMIHLKRTAAEREVLRRGGLVVDVVNEHLDYLIVGEIPSPAWMHGDYGRKIERARTLVARATCQLRIVSEGVFLDALAAHPALDSPESTTKVLVVTYSFVADEHGVPVDCDALEKVLSAAHERYGFHVTVKTHWIPTHRHLFAADDHPQVTSGTVVTCRLVAQLAVPVSAATIVDDLTRSFEGVAGADGTVRWFERTAGSADYVRLVRELPMTWRPSPDIQAQLSIPREAAQEIALSPLGGPQALCRGETATILDGRGPGWQYHALASALDDILAHLPHPTPARLPVVPPLESEVLSWIQKQLDAPRDLIVSVNRIVNNDLVSALADPDPHRDASAILAAAWHIGQWVSDTHAWAATVRATPMSPRFSMVREELARTVDLPLREIATLGPRLRAAVAAALQNQRPAAQPVSLALHFNIDNEAPLTTAMRAAFGAP